MSGSVWAASPGPTQSWGSGGPCLGVVQEVRVTVNFSQMFRKEKGM